MFSHIGLLGFQQPNTFSSQCDAKSIEHKSRYYYLVLALRDDTASKCFLLGSLWGSQLLWIKRKISQASRKGLLLKWALREKCDEWLKFLGLSKLLETITVKFTTSYLLLLLYIINEKCNQLCFFSSFNRSVRLLIYIFLISTQEFIFLDKISEKHLNQ